MSLCELSVRNLPCSFHILSLPYLAFVIYVKHMSERPSASVSSTISCRPASPSNKHNHHLEPENEKITWTVQNKPTTTSLCKERLGFAVCVFLRAHICAHARLQAHNHANARVHVCVSACMHACMRASCVCVCVCVCERCTWYFADFSLNATCKRLHPPGFTPARLAQLHPPPSYSGPSSPPPSLSLSLPVFLSSESPYHHHPPSILSTKKKIQKGKGRRWWHTSQLPMDHSSRGPSC